jgi:hypothetical protein
VEARVRIPLGLQRESAGERPCSPSGRSAGATGTYTALGTFAAKRDAEATLEGRADKARGDWIDPEKGRVTFGTYSVAWLRTAPTSALLRPSSTGGS